MGKKSNGDLRAALLAALAGQHQDKGSLGMAAFKIGPKGLEHVAGDVPPDDILDMLKGILGDVDSPFKPTGAGGGDKADAPIPPMEETDVGNAMSMLAGLTNTTSGVGAYVKIFIAAGTLHHEVHDAKSVAPPNEWESMHAHVLAVASAVEALATIRFGKDAFDAAVEAELDKHTADLHKSYTDSIIPDDHPLSKLRPKR